MLPTFSRPARLPLSTTIVLLTVVSVCTWQAVAFALDAEPSSKTAEQIYQAIAAKRKHAYITKRWRLFAWFVKLAPDWLYNRLSG